MKTNNNSNKLIITEPSTDAGTCCARASELPVSGYLFKYIFPYQTQFIYILLQRTDCKVTFICFISLVNLNIEFYRDRLQPVQHFFF